MFKPFDFDMKHESICSALKIFERFPERERECSNVTSATNYGFLLPNIYLLKF